MWQDFLGNEKMPAIFAKWSRILAEDESFLEKFAL